MPNIDNEGYLVTETGHKVAGLQPTATMFMDKTIVAYGPSGTGKTVIVKNIMRILSGHIDQILLIAPTEPSNRSYAGFIDQPLIHYRLHLPDPSDKKDNEMKGGLRFLQAILKRQEMMAAIYTRANNPDVLAHLYSRLPRADRAEGLQYIEGINSKRTRILEQVRKQYAAEPGRCEDKVKEVNDKFKKMLVLIYKKYIAPRYADLYARGDLSEDERYSLCYLHFNPRLLLIFDDCAAQLKPYFNKDVFRLLFYQNRHSFITVIVCCQDDTDMPANLRKNAFISFFTEQIVCLSNFERTTNKFPKTTKTYVNEIVNDVFASLTRKLAYIREDSKRIHFYYIDFPYPVKKRFGSDAFHELCGAVEQVGVTMDRDNPFYDRFKV